MEALNLRSQDLTAVAVAAVLTTAQVDQEVKDQTAEQVRQVSARHERLAAAVVQVVLVLRQDQPRQVKILAAQVRQDYQTV